MFFKIYEKELIGSSVMGRYIHLMSFVLVLCDQVSWYPCGYRISLRHYWPTVGFVLFVKFLKWEQP
jgi:hypothetical protein